MRESFEQLNAYLRAIWRHRWHAALGAWVIALAGWIVVYKMPPRYEATARIYADTQSVLRPLLSGLAVQPNLDQMVAMMSQTLISGPNLEEIIRMSGLNENLATEADKAKLIARLRTEISIRSAGKENLYSITVVDRDSEVAKRIVQSLLTLFVEGSMLGNRKDSDSARNFIDEQLKSYREKLVDAENSITAFKRRHLGLMPGEGPGYFAQLNDTKAALNRATLELREAERARDSIQRGLETEMRNPSLPGDRIVVTGAAPESELDRRITSLEQKLDNLRLTYTEQHPDIVALVGSIAQLKEQRRAEESAPRAAPAVSVGMNEPLPPDGRTKTPMYQQLSMSLTAAESNVAVLRTRVEEYSRRYAELQAAANAMPQVEAEYAQLTRDYELNKARYAELLKRRDSAQISGDMGESDAAMIFRVVDPPRVISTLPGPKVLTTAVLGIALIGGLGVAFVFSQIHPKVDDERRLRELTGLHVLGTVLMTKTEAVRARGRRGLLAVGASYAGLLSAYAAIMIALMTTASRA